MTPEERLTKIENAVLALAEVQGKHDAQVVALVEQSEKQTAGIRDLIVVSRTVIDSQTQTTKQIQDLADAVRQLGVSVDRFLNGLQKPNGNQ